VDHARIDLDHRDPTLRQGVEAGRRRTGHRRKDRDASISTSEPSCGAQRATSYTRTSPSQLTFNSTVVDQQRFPNPMVGSRRLLDLATTSSYRLGARAARRLPAVVAAGMVAPAGLGANFASPARRAMIERHLRRVDPTLRGLRLRRAVQEAFDSYARYWLESFRLPNLSVATVERGFDVEGYQHIVDALDEGNGVILVLPHLGGWEWAGRWIVDQGHQITVVVEQIEPPELFEWFVDLRSKLGMQVVALGPDAGKTVMRALRDNHVVCLLADRDLQGGGPEVDFFGERTTLPGGPAMLGLRTGAPVLPTGVYFTNRVDGHFAVVRPPLPVERQEKRLRDDVQRITQLLAAELEALIRREPSQWHMFQPNWPSDPGYGDDLGS
jgi:KDO2-lipid IV(A) lauroyltransferase